MRILPTLLGVAAMSLALTACTGADAQKAQSLLAASAQAQESVGSEGFIVKMSVTAEKRTIEVDMTGGADIKGPDRGDFFARLEAAGGGTATPVDALLVKRGQRLEARVNGVTQQLPMPIETSGQSTASPYDLGALTSAVKDVSVSSTEVAGRAEDEITGTLDGHALLASLPGLSESLVSQAGVSLGDVKVSLFIPRDTHLVETALLDMTMHADGQSVQLSMSWAVVDVNKPVVLPSL